MAEQIETAPNLHVRSDVIYREYYRGKQKGSPIAQRALEYPRAQDNPKKANTHYLCTIT